MPIQPNRGTRTAKMVLRLVCMTITREPDERMFTLVETVAEFKGLTSQNNIFLPPLSHVNSLKSKILVSKVTLSVIVQ